MKFSVCIGSVRPTTLEAAIGSIRGQTWPDWELIIVGQGDDAALRATGAAAAARDARIRYLHLDRRGVSMARNVAVRAAEGDIIAITDDDCEARPDWLATLASYFAAEPATDVLGGAVLAPAALRPGLRKCPNQIPSEALYDPVASGRTPPSGWDWLTANVAFRPRVFGRAGPFDELFGPGAYFRVATDTEYKLRLEMKGVRMRTTPRAVVVHTHGYRYGFRPLLRRSMNYAFGHGALAGKLTLLHDPRGREWLTAMSRACTIDWLRHPKPHGLALRMLQFWNFNRGYLRCVRNYEVDPETGVLQPRESTSALPRSTPSVREAPQPAPR